MSARATITVCDTCNFAPEQKLCDGRSGGEIFAEAVEAAARAHPELRVRRFSCLMGCERHCNAALSAPGKMTYVLGKFEPTPEAAAALTEYAALYANSETGVVAYRQWPQGVKGHFVSRTPPLEQQETSEETPE